MISQDVISLLYPIKNESDIKIGVVYTQWNGRLIEMMYHDAISTFKQYGIKENNICSVQVPGAVEIPFAAKQLAETNTFSGILTLGCIIKGDTPHFEYVSMSVTQGVTQLNLTYNIPFIFGVLTTNNYQQELERSGIKGKEFAISLLNMIGLSQQLKK